MLFLRWSYQPLIEGNYYYPKNNHHSAHNLDISERAVRSANIYLPALLHA